MLSVSGIMSGLFLPPYIVNILLLQNIHRIAPFIPSESFPFVDEFPVISFCMRASSLCLWTTIDPIMPHFLTWMTDMLFYSKLFSSFVFPKL